jgi:hypothetical protein
MGGCVVRQHNESINGQPGSPSRQVRSDTSLRKHKSGILREHCSRLVVYNDAVVCSCILYSLTILHQFNTTFLPSFSPSKVRHSSIVTPVSPIAPSQRVVLRPSHLSSRRVNISLKLRLRASPNIRVQFFSIAVGSDSRALFQHGEHVARGL